MHKELLGAGGAGAIVQELQSFCWKFRPQKNWGGRRRGYVVEHIFVQIGLVKNHQQTSQMKGWMDMDKIGYTTKILFIYLTIPEYTEYLQISSLRSFYVVFCDGPVQLQYVFSLSAFWLHRLWSKQPRSEICVNNKGLLMPHVPWRRPATRFVGGKKGVLFEPHGSGFIDPAC